MSATNKDSPAKKDATQQSANGFTIREQEIMAMAWQCFEGEPKVDYKKLAGLCGMTNVASASNAWSKIKKKLAAQAKDAGVPETAADAGDEGAPTTPKSKATPGKRKKNAEAAADGRDDEESPTKKTKTPKGKGKGKKTGVKAEEDGSDTADAEDGIGVKQEESDEVDGQFN